MTRRLALVAAVVAALVTVGTALLSLRFVKPSPRARLRNRRRAEWLSAGAAREGRRLGSGLASEHAGGARPDCDGLSVSSKAFVRVASTCWSVTRDLTDPRFCGVFLGFVRASGPALAWRSARWPDRFGCCS